MVGQMKLTAHEQKSAAGSMMQQQSQQLVLQHQLFSIGTTVNFGRPPNLWRGAMKIIFVGGTTRAY